uniref:Uncharacterized protein n=1 Tax=Avena sativa TaxID=4498 RepID=A0ACD5ZAN0_AVESA
MANPSASEMATSCKAHKRTCLCSPTNHPGSFRCSRHRTPRARPPLSSSLVRASQHQAVAPSAKVIMSGGGSRMTSKGRPALRAHLQRLLAGPPPSSGCRCREFMPRLSRLGRLAVSA